MKRYLLGLLALLLAAFPAADNAQVLMSVSGGVGGGGSVTSVTCGTGLTGGTITTTGTCALASPAGGGSGGVSTGTGPLLEALPNNTSTGTTANKIVKVTNAGQVVTSTTSDTINAAGICFPGVTGFSCGTSGNAMIAVGGQVSCIFDGSTTAGDFVVVSTTAAGDCHDAGSSVPATVQVVGIALTTNVGAGTYSVDLDPVGVMGVLTGKINSLTCSNITNSACLNAQQQWTAGQAVTPTTLTISTATFTPTFNTSNHFNITLVHASCPCTLANPSGGINAGQAGQIVVKQSSTGSDLINTWGSDYLFPSGTKPTLSTGANAIDILSYYAIDSTHIAITNALNFQ